MKLGSHYRCVSGLDVDDLCFVCVRFPRSKGFKPTHSDSWIMRQDAEGLRPLYGYSGWATGLWYSGRALFATYSRGKVIHFSAIGDDAKGDVWDLDELPAALMGVWGLDEKNVFAWADRDLSSGIMFRWNGKKWAELPSPGFGVLDVHGVAKDLVLAVGRDGLAAHWNGKAWKRARVPTESNLNGVRVSSADEIWAVGEDGSVLRGSTQRWELVAEHATPLYSVARFAGETWVAAGEAGTGALRDGKVEIVKPRVNALRFDVRGHLLASCPTKIVTTADAKAWTGYWSEGEALGMLDSQEPLWT